MKRYSRIICLLALSALACAQAESSPVDSDQNALSDPAARFPENDSFLGVRDDFQPASLSQTTQVVVQLAGDPITIAQSKSLVKLSAAEKQAIRASLKASQAALQPSIQALGGRVDAAFQNAYNGMRVTIDRKQLRALRALPGVVGVHAVVPKEHDNTNGVPLVGAPAAWVGTPFVPGVHGEGIKVAILDTGIDYTHADFGGPGTTDAFLLASATSTQPADPALFGPNAPKVKGGTDLVGNAYNGDNDPQPDENPLDCQGHGSHVAGTAVGFGVLADGSTYDGPYDASTFNQAFEVGPGVAPLAELYSVRVFGCTGSTRVVVDAIEWAVDHDVDVISMSLGSPFGGPEDADAVASANAAKAGVLVVAASGNNGPSTYITSSPAAGEGVISVAASDPTPSFPAATVGVATNVPGKSFNATAINANGGVFADGTVLPFVVLKNPNGSISLGCTPAEYVNANVAGKIAVVARGTCARVARAIYGQKAGAAAVLMVNNTDSLPPFEGDIRSNPDTGEAYTVTIPFLGLPSSRGNALRDSGGGTMSLVNTTMANPLFKAFADFSSAGPSQAGALKPDVTAPGVSIKSAQSGSGNLGTRMSGTSMATPHAAGVAALARQAHPTWSAVDVKSALLNTADPGLVKSYKTSRGGTGLVQAQAVARTQAVAWSEPTLTTLNFGVVEMKVNFFKAKAIKVKNNGDTSLTFNVSVENPVGGQTMVPTVSSLTVPAHSTNTFEVGLTVPVASVGDSSAFREVAGLVKLTPAPGSNGDVTLRVPYYLVPRATANVQAIIARLATGASSTTATVSNKNSPIAASADFYAWGLSDANEYGRPSDLRALGLQAFPFPLKGDPDGQLLVFAVNTWAAWSTAATNEFDIYVDVDGDFQADYAVVGVDNGALTTGSFDGRMAVAVFSLWTGARALVPFAPSAPTNSSTVLLPVLTSNLCMANTPCLSKTTNPRLTYQVLSFDLANGDQDETATAARFNVWTPAISQGAFVPLAPNATAVVPVAIDRTEWAQTPALGTMIVSQDNRNGADEAVLLPVTP